MCPGNGTLFRIRILLERAEYHSVSLGRKQHVIVTLLLQLVVQMGLAQAAGVGSKAGDVLNPKFSLP